ncbi:hypothetical protein L1887_12546 [Cichorium endivia]|nr:hypothetical protein L1887_12546 [Cichorium endivia]
MFHTHLSDPPDCKTSSSSRKKGGGVGPIMRNRRKTNLRNHPFRDVNSSRFSELEAIANRLENVPVNFTSSVKVSKKYLAMEHGNSEIDPTIVKNGTNGKNSVEDGFDLTSKSSPMLESIEPISPDYIMDTYHNNLNRCLVDNSRLSQALQTSITKLSTKGQALSCPSLNHMPSHIPATYSCNSAKQITHKQQPSWLYKLKETNENHGDRCLGAAPVRVSLL